MGFDQSHVDSAFAALGLGPPSPAEVTAIEAVNGPIVWVDYSQSNQTFEFPALPAAQVISELPEVQSQVVPVAQMFDVALGYFPLQKTLASMVASDLTESQLATALVSSQAFANVNNGGVLLDPNQPVSAGLVDALFINTLGHPPSVATLDGFEGLTNAQAFLAFANVGRGVELDSAKCAGLPDGRGDACHRNHRFRSSARGCRGYRRPELGDAG